MVVEFVIARNPDARHEYESAMRRAWQAKARLLELGVPIEFALYVLPNAITLLDPPAPVMPAVDGKATAYVCENFTCQLPVTEPAELGKLLG